MNGRCITELQGGNTCRIVLAFDNFSRYFYGLGDKGSAKSQIRAKDRFENGRGTRRNPRAMILLCIQRPLTRSVPLVIARTSRHYDPR